MSAQGYDSEIKDEFKRLNTEHFDISAAVVFQLGQELIADEIQALIELLKNSYDANSKSAQVIIDTLASPPAPWGFKDAKGYLLITDSGTGMNPHQIKDGWITISNSAKKLIKSSSKLSDLPRVPLGDKGLGRLGAQRIGNNLELITRPKDSEWEYYVGFSWSAFVAARYLSSVPIEIKSRRATMSMGTHIMISDLINTDIWLDQTDEGLATRVSRLISPFGGTGFTVTLKVNGRGIPLVAIAKSVLSTAIAKYIINFDGERFSVEGSIKLDFLTPSEKLDSPEWSAYSEAVEKDGGVGFLQYLLNDKKRPWQTIDAAEDGWYVNFGYTTSLSSIDKPQKVIDLESKRIEVNPDGTPAAEVYDLIIANPGPFRGEIYAINLGRQSVAKQEIFAKGSDFKSIVKNLSGIRVYRDGFGVRVDDDWLGLGRQQTEGGSYNGLKPGNTIGYISISARENQMLAETTSREGFTLNPYYSNLLSLLKGFVVNSNRIQEYLRKAVKIYYGEIITSIRNTTPMTTPEQIAEHITKSLGDAASLQQPVLQISKRADETINNLESLPNQSQNLIFTPEVDAARSEVHKSLVQVQAIAADLNVRLAEFSQLQREGEVLATQISDLRKQLQDALSIVAVGLSAEMISHEIRTIADRVIAGASRTRNALRYQKDVPHEILLFINDTISSMTSLRKQMSHLDPGLRYAKDRKENLSVKSFIEDLIPYYKDRFRNRDIDVVLKIDKDFKCNLSRGKLIQVIDNLVLNSEYWLRNVDSTNNADKGAISFVVSRPFLRVYDNGPGIDKVVERDLFEPFVTTKGAQRGRGLGLFIAQQLLEGESASIRLLPERNAAGNLYIFEIDLSGAML